MERKDFLQGIGLLGFGCVIPARGRSEAIEKLQTLSCTLTPSETTGPYPYTGTVPTDYTSSPLYRSNIIGDLPAAGGGGTLTNVIYNSTTFPGTTSGGGIGLFLTLTVQNTDCIPVQGARVDIWQCDKRGYYSGYSSSQNGGDQSSYTFLRGIQTTDANGQVTFTSIFPSWYIPRAIHFHVQVYYNGSLALTSQLAIPDAVGTTVNSSTAYNRTYTFNNSTDQVFSDGFSSQLVAFNTDSNNTRGYIGSNTLVASIATLPLTLTAFEAGVDKQNVVLKWTSENELNVSHFEIERASDTSTFTKVGAVAANNTVTTNQYSFTDGLLNGISYYRLKMVDKDGASTYSKIVAINGKAFLNAIAFPTPVKDVLNVQHLNTDANTTVKILNIAGVIMAQKKLPANITQTDFNVSAFAPATYLLVIETSNGNQIIKFNKL